MKTVTINVFKTFQFKYLGSCFVFYKDVRALWYGEVGRPPRAPGKRGVIEISPRALVMPKPSLVAGKQLRSLVHINVTK